MVDEKTFLFEISWEVCNKIGGIYTVIKSKTSNVKSGFSNYFVVGPYFPAKHASEFIEEKVPDEFSKGFDALAKEGIICHYGKWLTDIDVDAILIDFKGFSARKDKIKEELWNNYRIDSLYTSWFDFDEPVVWAYAAGRMVEELSKGRKAIAHCHEWLAGAALLYLKSRKARVATVFTTHATVLGRSLTGAGVDIYNDKAPVDINRPDYKASIKPKHQVEEQAAKNADAFTTVSSITDIEAQRFLGRKADVLLLNGLNISKFPTFEEASIKHRLFREKMKRFLLQYFFPYYTFDIENTLIYFLAGRYEFRAKGIDVFIKALGELNRKLIEEKSDQTVAAFFWVPGNVKGIKRGLDESRVIFKDIKDSIRDEQDALMGRLLTSIIGGRQSCDEKYLLGDSLMAETRRKILRFKHSGTPPLSTHDLANEDSDEILNAFKAEGLINRREDRVKVIFYSIYLTGADDLLDLSYYEAMQGSHLGVFPSFYEPWGYTPVEAAALGVSSITTDLSGFGRYICKDVSGKKLPGIFVTKRLGKSDDYVVKELARILYDFASLDAQDRIKNKIEAKRIASITDWKYMIKNYFRAYGIALEKAGL